VPVLREAPEPEPRDLRARMDAYAAAYRLRKHFPTVARFPEEAVAAIMGEPPTVRCTPRAKALYDGIVNASSADEREGSIHA
jgi:hypothetical protein